MDDAIPSISSGSVGSRFVSQGEVDSAKARRDEQWKAAYARLGQEPPPQPTEDAFDGRSLAEKLAANKAAKQDEWEERNRLANQFRALEEDEILFLDSVRERQLEEERQREEKDSEEVKSFKQAVAARESVVAKPVVISPPFPGPGPAASVAGVGAAKTNLTGSIAVKPAAAAKKNGLKGVVVKKKKTTSTASSKAPLKITSEKVEGKDASLKTDEEPAAKRRKASSP